MRLRLGGAKSQTRGCQEQIHWKPGTQLLYGEDIRMRVWSFGLVHGQYTHLSNDLLLWPYLATYEMRIHGYPGATNSRACLVCPQLQITQRLKDQFVAFCRQDVPRVFHCKSLHLSGEEVFVPACRQVSVQEAADAWLSCWRIGPGHC